jgi:hypothetical protein
MLFPIRLAAMAAEISHRPGAMIAAVLVLLVLGGFLSIKAYSRD